MRRDQLLTTLLCLLAVFAALVAGGCGPESARYEVTGVVLGTDAVLSAYGPDEETVQDGFELAFDRVERIESLMSTYRPASEVSRLNLIGADTPVQLSPMTLDVLRASLDVSRKTGGVFDVTYAPLRTVWRAAAKNGELPSDDMLAEARARVGYEKLIVGEDGRVSFAVAGMELDLGGIAKGYAIDLAVEALQERGLTSGIVDIGHDLRIFGERPEGGKWRVGVHRPPGVEDQIVLELDACAVTTSGDYARGFDVDGVWYSHIIDPRTGMPAKDVTSVTVVGPDAMTADALATALSITGAQEGIALVESMPDFECLFMTRLADESIRIDMSSGFEALIAQE